MLCWCVCKCVCFVDVGERVRLRTEAQSVLPGGMKVLDVDFGVAMLGVLLGPHDKTLLSTDTSDFDLLNLETKNDRPEKTENQRDVSLENRTISDTHKFYLGVKELQSCRKILQHLNVVLGFLGPSSLSYFLSRDDFAKCAQSDTVLESLLLMLLLVCLC